MLITRLHQTSLLPQYQPKVSLPILNLRDMAGHKPIIAMRLLVLFLGFSCLLSSLAVPSTKLLFCFTGSLKSSSEEDDGELSVPNLLAQDEIMGMSGGGEMVFMERRMEMESNDYPGTGANNHHDPKTPGRG
ncbi:uncharacterized protein LOC104443364 isoform X1 [Eucalyptus grandis]|uniref:Uncharacterized protein n=2 Tax=Eucalyptus grandis TaxID=71139 RepID=A0ACC3M6B8_EUCGR|nr:uncharacterized protein LOC104443364 isoform X1 [Eucalyptus grandis]KAK3446455.1 hypothetical protein EUGRSUZ_A02145 [Eucalyptus grandis]